MESQRKLLKELRSLFSSMDSFESPVVELEQYETGEDIASHVLAVISEEFDDFNSKVVADLGCGTGRLALGALYCNAAHVVGFDACENALQICASNYEHAFEADFEFCLPRLDLVHCDIVQLLSDPKSRWRNVFDVVIMNPPFGTKNNAGIDVKFVQLALRIAPVVYSMHKSSTRPFLQRIVQQADFDACCSSNDNEVKCNKKVSIKILAQLRFDLPKVYKFHRDAKRDIDVDFIRFSRA